MRQSVLVSLFFFVCLSFRLDAQTFSVTGRIVGEESGEGVAHATVQLKNTPHSTIADENGHFVLPHIPPGSYILSASALGHKEATKEVVVTDKNLKIHLHLHVTAFVTDSVVISGQEKTFGLTQLKDVEGTAIYAGKKTEAIVMKDITVNTATNNSRQIFAKVAGLNIWESDGAGIQLGIGGRGLSPQRTTNFNTRQNGYDMSADALGYPESYYSPPADAIDRIEIVRGAASLQYGTQFGGMVNFKLKRGPEDKKIQVISRQTLGSWGFFNSFNSIGGTVKKLNYYGFYQHKSGNGWRPNSEFEVTTAYSSMTYKASPKLSFTFEYTYMDYWAHQPGGMTDANFLKDPRTSTRDRNWFRVNWNLGAAILDYNFTSRLKLNSRFFGLIASRSALGNLTNINRADDPSTNRDLWIDHYNNWGNETRLLYNYKIARNACAFVVGARYYSGFTDRKQGLGNNGSTGDKSDFQFLNPDKLEFSQYTFPNHNVALFMENIFRITPKFSVIPGIRYENIVTRANGFYNKIVQDRAGNILLSQKQEEQRVNMRSFVIGGVGASYSHSEAFQLYANISQNYRAINFNDMRVVNPNMQVDPNLQDEKGYSSDLGARGSIAGILYYDVSLFLIHYDNRIGAVQKTDSSTFNIYRLRTNVAQSRNYGVESFIESDIWRIIRGDSAKTKISLFSNFSLLDARYVHSQESAYENKKVELVPNVIFKGGLTIKRKKWSLSYQFSYTGSQFTDATNATFTANAINGTIPSYYTMDVSGQYTLNRFLSLSGSINNLSNNFYFTRRADSYPGPGIIPADGRSFYLTLQVKI
jgi:Fe(3+) dicitrate transport protein